MLKEKRQNGKSWPSTWKEVTYAPSLIQEIILHQFVVKDEILYYVKEKSDGSLHYCLVAPQNFKNKAMEHAHINSGHLGQKKTILKAEELYYWNNLKVDICNYL